MANYYQNVLPFEKPNSAGRQRFFSKQQVMHWRFGARGVTGIWAGVLVILDTPEHYASMQNQAKRQLQAMLGLGQPCEGGSKTQKSIFYAQGLDCNSIFQDPWWENNSLNITSITETAPGCLLSGNHVLLGPGTPAPAQTLLSSAPRQHPDGPCFASFALTQALGGKNCWMRDEVQLAFLVLCDWLHVLGTSQRWANAE